MGRRSERPGSDGRTALPSSAPFRIKEERLDLLTMSKRGIDVAGFGDDQERERERERLRVAKACDRCKRKKTKCDGLNPCWACERSKLACMYSSSAMNNSSHMSSPVVTGASAGNGVSMSSPHAHAPVNYAVHPQPQPQGVTNSNGQLIEKLVDRIRVLEGMLEKKNNNNNASSSPAETGVATPASDDAFWETLNFEAHPKPIVCRHNYSRRYLMYVTNVLGRQLWDRLSPENQSQISSIPRIQGYGWNMSGVHYLKHSSVPPARVSLEPELEQYLLDYFLDHVNPLMAIIHKPVFIKQFHAYKNTKDKSECRLFMAIFYVACALAMRFSEIAGVRQYPRGLEEEVFMDGYQALQSFAFQWESFEIVQGLLLVALYLRTCHRQASTWAALGQAFRLAYALGLMRTGLYRRRTGYELQKAERIFWCCYTMDRLCTIDTGRSRYFKDIEISHEQPTEYVDDGWLTPAAFGLIRLSIIISRFPIDMGIDHWLMKAGLAESITNDLNALDEYMDHEFGLGSSADTTLAPTHPKAAGSMDPETVCQYRLIFYEVFSFMYQIPLFGMLELERKDLNTSLQDKEGILGTSKAIANCVDTLSQKHGGRINSPWWSIMLSTYTASMMMLVLLNSGTFDKREVIPWLTKTKNIIDILADDGRYAMGKECQWALCSINHLLCMKLQEGHDMVKSLGIDHGDPEVNMRHFASLGLFQLQTQVNPNNGDTNSTDISDTKEEHQHDQSPTPRLFTVQKPQYGSHRATNGNDNTTARYQPQQSFDDPGLASSVGWFDGWTFDIESSVASYLDNWN